MIPKELSLIEWQDIEALVAAGREEDDTIEFKSGFKGGDDYICLSDSEKNKALESIAREVIAFLNTRGGDVIIGLQEKSGDHPRAESIRPIKQPQEASDRIARGLAAIIEPAQTSIAMRALSDPSDTQQGAIIIRVRPSTRAPHRSKRSLEAFARRGTESVPMPMDEIQDLTMYRSRMRQERNDLLDRQFTGFRASMAEQHTFDTNFVHIRTVFFPLTEQEIELDAYVLGPLTADEPSYYERSGAATQNDVAFRDVWGSWRSILRGQKLEHFTSRDDGFKFAGIQMKQSGIATFDFAMRYAKDGELRFHYSWLIGYLARVSDSVKRLVAARPTLAPAVLRLGLHVSDPYQLLVGESHWGHAWALPAQLVFLPDSPIASPDDANEFFRQAQIDVMSIVGQNEEHPFSLVDPNGA
ncbi:MAG TPA: ATP-binding protein [Allosphingosinicella sp.]